jgi:hypothetical protein
LQLRLLGLELLDLANFGFDELLEFGQQAAEARGGGLGSWAFVVDPIARFAEEQEAVKDVEAEGDGKENEGWKEEGMGHLREWYAGNRWRACAMGKQPTLRAADFG